MKTLLIIFFGLLANCELFAQQDTIVPKSCNTIYIGASLQYGFIWIHRPSMANLVKKQIPSFELDVCKNTIGNKTWHAPYHYPMPGIAIHIVPLGNPAQLGTAIGVYPYVNFPIGKREHNFKLYARFGWGVGYVTKCFDPIENHQSIAIGSHFNACLSLRLNAELKIGEKKILEFGMGITHFSNGAVRLPNLGLNIPMINLHYYFGIKEIHHISNSSKVFNDEKRNDRLSQIQTILKDKRWHLSGIIVMGMNDIDPPGGRRFGVLNFKSSCLKQVGKKSRFGWGIDVMYSQAIQHKLNYSDRPTTFVGALQPGVKVCYEWVLGRVTLPLEFGYYVYSKFTGNGAIYNRYGIHYLINENLIATMDIKTHNARAEYFEFGVGWRFSRK